MSWCSFLKRYVAPTGISGVVSTAGAIWAKDSKETSHGEAFTEFGAPALGIIFTFAAMCFLEKHTSKTKLGSALVFGAAGALLATVPFLAIPAISTTLGIGITSAAVAGGVGGLASGIGFSLGEKAQKKCCPSPSDYPDGVQPENDNPEIRERTSSMQPYVKVKDPDDYVFFPMPN